MLLAEVLAKNRTVQAVAKKCKSHNLGVFDGHLWSLSAFCQDCLEQSWNPLRGVANDGFVATNEDRALDQFRVGCHRGDQLWLGKSRVGQVECGIFRLAVAHQFPDIGQVDLPEQGGSRPSRNPGWRGQATTFDADGGDGCVIHRQQKVGAPTAEFAESARAEC